MCERKPPREKIKNTLGGGCCNTTLRRHLPGGKKIHTHPITPHHTTPHTHETWTRSTSSSSERRGKRRRTRRRRARGDAWAIPDGAGSFRITKKGPLTREHLDAPFTLRKVTESTGRTSYELSQKLDALRYSQPKCAHGG